MKVIFFGAGSHAKHLWTQIIKDPEFYTDEYIAFADNNKNIWGSNFCGKEVIAPSRIYHYGIDIILIASILYEDVMRKQLVEDLGISDKKVYIWEDYKRLCYANRVYREKYKNTERVKESEQIGKDRVVIYTAITGNYDTLKDPLFTNDSLTYVCFTNNPKIKSKIWNVRYIEDAHLDNVHLARHIKMNPHLFFPEYDMSIWVDGKFQILDDLRVYAKRYRRQSGILCFPHPERLCICDELAACILWTNGINKDMIVQVADYLKKDFPVNYGLYDTGCIVRFHNDDSIKRLMEEWENEVKNYSFRDQLSFPYVCWKNKYIPDICDLDIAHNQWLQYTGHKK